MKLIVQTFVLLFIVFTLRPGVLAKEPEIIPAKNWHRIEDGVFLIEEGDHLEIRCRGEGRLQFSTQKLMENVSRLNASISFDSTSGIYTFSRPNAVGNDTGWYACAKEGIKVRNDEQITEHRNGNDISWIYVYVNSSHPLAVTYVGSSPYIRAIAEGTVVVPCRPTSPEKEITLYKNSELLPTEENVIYDPKIGFIIKFVDGGESTPFYECGCDGEQLSDPLFSLNIETSVTISNTDVKVNPMLQAVQGEDLTLPCNITVPTGTGMTLEWHAPDSVSKQKFIMNDSYSFEGDQRITYFRNLTITDVQESDSGKYICKATSYSDSAQSTTHVKILGSNNTYINWTVDGDKFAIEPNTETEDAKWKMNIHSYPIAEVNWYKDGKLIENVGTTNESKYSRSVDKTTYLYKISNLTISDNGNYTIRISAGHEMRSISLHLTVNVLPVTQIFNQSRYYKPGDDVAFACNATSFPRSNVKWSFSEWPSGKIVNIGPLTNITSKPAYSGGFSVVYYFNTSATTMGNLTCKTCNKIGCNQDTKEIFVSDGNGFFGIVKPKSVIEGDDLNLTCAASRFNYTEKIRWKYKGSTELKVIPGKTSITSTTTKFTFQSILRIRGVTIKDAGNYSCEAETAASGIDTRSFNLMVENATKPHFTSTNMNGLDVEIDLAKDPHITKKFTCLAEGKPAPEVTWRKNGKLLTSGRQYVFSSKNTVLFIKSFDVGEDANYSCIAKNRVNSVERFVNIKIKGKTDSTIIWVSSICVFIVIIIIVIGYMSIKIHRESILRKELLEAGLTHFEEGALECLNPDLTVDDQVELLPYDKKWEFPRELLKLGKQLGSGAFGVVMKAEARGICVEEEVTTVAVKMVRRSADPSYMKALSSELKIMIHLGRHLNVVNLLGACTKTIITKRELYVIVEYCRFGNLHNYLQRHRASFIDQIDPFTQKIDPNIGMERIARSESVGSQNRLRQGALSFSRSISGVSSDSNSGTDLIYYRHGTDAVDVNMSPDGGVLSNNSVQPGWRSNYRGDYREQNLKPICTQDLLCWAWQVSCGMKYLSNRNVLHGDLAARNILLADNNIVKICDFGLAKNMYKDNNYQKKGEGPLPIKWMAIESIRDRMFSTQSDVWSFGIVLWEFFTLAFTPYPGMEAEKQYDRLIEGYRMEKPEYATDEIYDFMLHCWKAKPSLRPTFPELVDKIGFLLSEGVRMRYEDLNTPYMDMNTLALQNGQNDYLTMMSSPDHHYLNSPDPMSEACSSSNYLPMSPVNNIGEPGIFSPRPGANELQFDFPPPKDNVSSDSEPKDSVEGEEMPGTETPEKNPAYLEPVTEDLINLGKEPPAVKKEPEYGNRVKDQSLNNPKVSNQILNELDSQKNNKNQSSSPEIFTDNNYINLPKKSACPPEGTVDSFSNPSYVIMSK